MAMLSNYSDLVAAVSRWVHRTNQNFIDDVPNFISLAEMRINNLMSFRLAEQEANLTATPNSRFIALPADFQAPLALWLTSFPQRIEIIYRVPERLNVTKVATLARHYTIDGQNIAFECPAFQDYTYALRYTAKYNLANTLTNYVMTNYPMLYLFGALAEAAIYTGDDNGTAKWEALFKARSDEAMKTEARSKSSATLVMDSALVNRGRFNIVSGDYNIVP